MRTCVLAAAVAGMARFAGIANQRRGTTNTVSVRLMAVLLALICLCITQSSEAQSRIPLSLDVQPGFAFPRGALDERWGVGLSLGVNAAAELRPSTRLYVGYSVKLRQRGQRCSASS